MGKRRMPLTAVMGRSSAGPSEPSVQPASTPPDVSVDPVQAGSPPAAVSENPAPKRARKIGRRRAGHEQLNVLLPANVRREARVKAMREGRDISDVVTQLLQSWLTV